MNIVGSLGLEYALLVRSHQLYSCLKSPLDKNKLMRWELEKILSFCSMSSSSLICATNHCHAMSILQNIMYNQYFQNLLFYHEALE